MGKVRAHAKRDANEKDIVKLIRSLGGGWVSTASIPGELDGIIGYAGHDIRCEIKDGTKSVSRRALSMDEQKTFDEWPGRPPVIIECDDDVINLFNELRRT